MLDENHAELLRRLSRIEHKINYIGGTVLVLSAVALFVVAADIAYRVIKHFLGANNLADILYGLAFVGCVIIAIWVYLSAKEDFYRDFND